MSEGKLLLLLYKLSASRHLLVFFSLCCICKVLFSYPGLEHPPTHTLPLPYVIYTCYFSGSYIVCLFATIYYDIYLRVENIIWPFCENMSVHGGVTRTWKGNSLHLIFIFLNDGEMMPIIYASCIAKWGNL